MWKGKFAVAVLLASLMSSALGQSLIDPDGYRSLTGIDAGTTSVSR